MVAMLFKTSLVIVPIMFVVSTETLNQTAFQLPDEEKSEHSDVLKVLQRLEDRMEAYEYQNQELLQRMQELERENNVKNVLLRDMYETISDVALQANQTQHLLAESQRTRTKRQTVPRIAFSAYLSRTNSSMVPGQAVKFDQVLLNEGKGYNPYTGAFTAPISGTYLFSFHFDSHAHTFVRLDIDGINEVDAVANPHTGTLNTEVMSSNTVILHVGIGQAVLVEVFDVSGEVASSYKYRLSTFTGFLLHPEI